MIYLFFIIYFIILPTVILIALYKIADKLENIKGENKNNNQSVLAKRKHTSIKPSNYNNVFANRKSYKEYENEKGLYEPITPHKPGVKIKKKEE